MKRQTLVVFALLLLSPSTLSATETVAPIQENMSPTTRFNERIRFRLSTFVYDRSESSFLDSVSMRSFPAGSLVTLYEGFHGFALKHARSQYRRFVRRAVDKGWYVQTDEFPPTRAFFERLDHDQVDPNVNGAWWTRHWWESLPPEKGGAPVVPYFHTYGEDTAWRLGPITVTNTFKFKFDYIGFFGVNPDPVSHEHSERSLPISLDVRTPETASFGTHFRFRLRPYFRLGVPRDGNWMDILRGLSLQAPFEIRQRGLEVITGEIEVKWRPDDGLVLVLEIALANW